MKQLIEDFSKREYERYQKNIGRIAQEFQEDVDRLDQGEDFQVIIKDRLEKRKHE